MPSIGKRKFFFLHHEINRNDGQDNLKHISQKNILKGLFGEPEVTSFTLDESIGTWKLKKTFR
jgi:hypothetical protein